MRNFHPIFIILIIALNFSCSSPEDDKSGFQELKISEADLVPFDQLVNEIEFIPFLIPEESPLKLNANAPNLAIDDKIYFSTGDYRNASVYVFDLDGKYIEAFNKQGEGPEEYPYLNTIDIIENKLAVWDDMGGFKLYNKDNFNFEGTKKLRGADLEYIPDYKFLGNDKWILVGDFNGELDENSYYPVFHVLDEKTEKMKTLSAKARAVTSNIIEGQIAEMDDKSYLLNFGASDTLFHYKNDSLYAWIKLNLSDNNLPENEKLNPEDFFEKVVASQAYNFNIGTALAAKDVVRIGLFGIKKSPEISEEDMSTLPIQHLYIHYPSKQFSLTKAFGAFAGKGYAKDGFFYEILYAEDVQNYLESNYFGKYKEQLEKAMDNLIDEEDPILLKYNVSVK